MFLCKADKVLLLHPVSNDKFICGAQIATLSYLYTDAVFVYLYKGYHDPSIQSISELLGIISRADIFLTYSAFQKLWMYVMGTVRYLSKVLIMSVSFSIEHLKGNSQGQDYKEKLDSKQISNSTC